MSGSFSVLGIVGIEVALVHVFVLGDTSDDEPQDNHGEDALPHGLGDLIPHLLVEQVDLLKTLKIIQS